MNRLTLDMGEMAAAQAHAVLAAKVQALRRGLDDGKATLTADLASFLRGRLINHVFKSDKAGAREIAGRPSWGGRDDPHRPPRRGDGGR